MVWWSAAAALHATGQGVRSFAVYRILLGAGEAGSFAACVRGVAEWFPQEQRGLANGIWGAGTSFGLIVTVPLVVWITGIYGWRAAFLLTATSGFVWVAVWLLLHPSAATPITSRETVVADAADAQLDRPIRFRSLLMMRSVWALLLARFFVDPVVWFYNSWVPEFLKRSEGFSMAEIGRYGWIPFGAQFVGIVLGGVLSDALCRRQWRVLDARMAVMLCGVLLMTAGLFAAYPIHIIVSLAAISLSTFGFGLWAPNMMSLCADAFGTRLAGSVTGLTGIGAGVGGVIYTLFTGWTLDHFGYRPVFISASMLPLLAFATLRVLLDRERFAPATHLRVT
jgi:ACS family hexuronate transporter-like MFS transporter